MEGRKAAERFILSGMIKNINAIELFINELGFLVDDNCQILAMNIIDEYRKHKEVVVANFYNTLKDEQKDLLLEVSTDDIYNVDYDENNFKGYLSRVKKWMLEDETEHLKQKIQQEIDTDNELKLMIKYRENLIELRRYNDE